ncbi:MAG: hypothetical protein ABW252_20895 [Polyangiales bacterium]
MTHFPPATIHEQRRKVLRRVGIALSALMVLTVLTVFGFIVKHESAHDEAACPFKGWSERTFEGGVVYEEQRSCVDGITERRYRVARAGKPSYELARKRLATDRFEQARYRWELVNDVAGKLIVKIYVDDKISSEFREEDAVVP